MLKRCGSQVFFFRLAMAPPRLAWLLCTVLRLCDALDDTFAVAAYLPEWRYDGANWESISKHVTHLILFSLEPTPSGEITALERLPRPALLKRARKATAAEGAKLLLCFGGNGRSSGFGPMSRSPKARKAFVANLVALLDKWKLDGVDYNWEYPGYVMGRGYGSDAEIAADYAGLKALVKETAAAFEPSGRVITAAYYPDGKQESLFREYGIDGAIDLLHAMSYDQSGPQHSPFSLAEKAVALAKQHLPPNKCTLGVPFYGRDGARGDWTTYEDLQQDHWDVLRDPSVDAVRRNGAAVGFNGAATIERKTTLALEEGLGGIMIWEVGQDCRLAETSGKLTHGATVHPRTCRSDDASLLLAISRARAAFAATPEL